MLQQRVLYTGLLVVSLGGFLTSYLPGVWGMPPAFWVSDLIETLSYFTIISNLLVAALAISQLFFSQRPFGQWMHTAPVQTSLAVYITITGLVYHWLLADTWNPTGIDKFSDVLLHTVTPLLYILYWWLEVRGKTMAFKHTVKVLAMPALFLAYWLVRGPIVGSYPYFFMDVGELGATIVAINLTGLALLCWLLGAVYWALSRYTTPLYV